MHVTNTNNPIDFPKNETTEAINIIRKLWYEENNKDTSNMDSREIAIHVGIKVGYIKAIEAIGANV